MPRGPYGGGGAIETIVEFLQRHPNVDYCDECLGAELQLPRRFVQKAAQRLAAQPGFVRDTWLCLQCTTVKTVLRWNGVRDRGRGSGASA